MKNSKNIMINIKRVLAPLLVLSIVGCATIPKDNSKDFNKYDTNYKTSPINIKGSEISPTIVSTISKTYLTLPSGVIVRSVSIDNKNEKFIKLGSYWIIDGTGYKIIIDTNKGMINSKNLSDHALNSEHKAAIGNGNQQHNNPGKLLGYKINFNKGSSAINLNQVNQLATIPMKQDMSVTSCASGTNYGLYISRGMKVTTWLLNHDNSHVTVKFNGLNKNCSGAIVEVSLG
jgi:hypothetical protein